MPTLCHQPGCNRTAGTCASCIKPIAPAPAPIVPAAPPPGDQPKQSG